MFETVLAGHPLPRRRALAGPLSVVLHFSAFAAIVIASAWRIGDVGEPKVPIVLVAPAPPPPRAETATSPAPATPRPSPATPRTDIRPMPLVPSVTPVQFSGSPSADPLPGIAMDGPGSPDGVEGGAGESASPGIGTDGAPISATAPDVVSPRLLLQVPPEYPETARRIREQGLVLLQAVIGTSGAVEDVRVVSSRSPLFDETALRAVRQWRYSPATLAGRAVRVYLTVTIRFTFH